jgi:hypothetical protein
VTRAIQGGWKKCFKGHEGHSVEPHLDFCFEHAPPEYRRAWYKREAELRAHEQALIDYYGLETYEWAQRTMRGALRLPPET